MPNDQKTEGTISLDGLVEGPLPERADAEQVVRDWVSMAGQMGLSFHLELDGRSFNLMPETHAVPVREVGEPPEQHIADALEQLARLVADETDGHVFSTLRSAHYEQGAEVQTLYAVQADGSVQADQRTVDADTVPPPAPPRPQEFVKTGLVVLGILAVLFGISAIFVDYGELWSRFAATVSPTDPADIEVDAGDFGGMIALAARDVEHGKLILTIERGQRYPTDTNLQALWERADDPREKLALEALIRGYVRVEYFVEDDGFYMQFHTRVRPLEENDSIEIRMLLPSRRRLQKVRLTY